MELTYTEPTLLTMQKVYQIDGCLYRFLYSKEGRIKKYVFRPLGGQRKKADVWLASQKIYSQVQEVPAMYNQVGAEIQPDHIQLSLF